MSSVCNLTGKQIGPLCNRQLPTKEDIFLAFKHHSAAAKAADGKKLNRSDLIDEVADEVLDIWSSARIPTLPERKVVQQIKSLLGEAEAMERQPAMSKKGRPNAKRETFVASLRRLFDIAACKCTDNGFCVCPKEHRVPKMIVKFLKDQRGDRAFKIPDPGTWSLPPESEEEEEEEKKKGQDAYTSDASSSTYDDSSDDGDSLKYYMDADTEDELDVGPFDGGDYITYRTMVDSVDAFNWYRRRRLYNKAVKSYRSYCKAKGEMEERNKTLKIFMRSSQDK